MSKISIMLENAKRHVDEEKQYYEDRIAQLSKRLSRVRELVIDPSLIKEHPEQVRRLIRSATYGYMDVQKTEPIE